MPAFETMDRPQTATYWPKIGDSNLGLPVVGSPVQLSVQWDDHSAEVLDPKGNVVTVDATMFASQTLLIDSVVKKGTLAEWQGTGSADVPSRLMMIKTVNITPDIKGRNVVYFYGLMRYNDDLPTS